MSKLRRLTRLWREFWSSVPDRVHGSYVVVSSDGITRLSALCPTVTEEEMKKLEDKRNGVSTPTG